MMRTCLFRSGLVLGVLLPATLRADAPEISHVFPDFGDVRTTRVITGENFTGKKVSVWVMRSPRGEAAIEQSAAKLGTGPLKLPARPPKGSHCQPPLDVEKQVITVNIGHHFRPMALWVQTSEGFSKPVLVDVPKPFWINRHTAVPGDVLYMYGFGLHLIYRKTYVVLKSVSAAHFAKVVTMARARRVRDPRLVHFEVPRDAAPGRYDVYVHNSRGGAYGWRKAGTVNVVRPKPTKHTIVNARTFGAKGDGLADDGDALGKAMGAAAKTGGVVFLPPGTYRTDETLIVPSNVTLRGSGRDNTIVEGFGYDPLADRVAWHTQHDAPGTPVIRMNDHTTLERLTVTGACSKGPGGFALVEAVPRQMAFPLTAEVCDLTVRDCRLVAQGDLATGRAPYRGRTLYFGPTCRRVQFLSNEVHGGVTTFQVTRLDMIGNKFHGGNVSGRMWDSLVDANLFVDTPTRFLLYPRRHCHIRFNEIHQAFRGTWCNAEEIFLVHGGFQKHFGFATGAGPATLTDSKHNWKPGQREGETVLIVSGRGFGQYRQVEDNTRDTLKLETPWRVVPDRTSEYVVSPMFVENDFYANLNNTSSRLSLWLDVVANIVDMHRDVHAKGSDIWGQDRSKIDKQGKARGVGRFYPAFYNMIVNSWMDGSYAHLWSGAEASNIYVGTPMFANYVVSNKIRQAHMHRTGFTRQETALGAILVGNASGSHGWHPKGTDMTKPQDERVALSHSIVEDNFLTFTNVGISVSDFARKTFLMNNVFQGVDRPILDWGAGTVVRNNKRFTVTDKGETYTPIPDRVNPRKIQERKRPSYTIPQEEAPSQLYQTVGALHYFVSIRPLAIYGGVNSQAVQARCAANLKAVYGLLKRYDAKHGGLPRATFFPENPRTDPDSLVVLLGKEAGPHLVCPTCGPDFHRLGLNYVWNEKLSGKRLSNIKDASKTWLMMDFVGTHTYMVRNRFCGHLGKVNVLYADGTVRHGGAPVYNHRLARKGDTLWVDWAKK